MVRNRIEVNPWSNGDPNFDRIENFLAGITNEHTKAQKLKKLRWLIDWLYENKGTKFLLDYTPEELQACFRAIEAMATVVHDKKKYLIVLRQLIDAFTDPYKARNLRYNENDYNWIFTKMVPDLHDAGGKHDKHYISPAEWDSLLATMKARDSNDYVLFKFFRSGVRVGGAVKVRVKDVNFAIGYFDTREKQAKEKSDKRRYFLADEFLPELRWYIDRHHLQAGDKLFDLTTQSIRRILKRYSKYLAPHDFRRSIERLWKDAGMDIIDRNTLANHAQSIDGIYSADDAWDNPAKVHSTYEYFYKKIFK